MVEHVGRANAGSAQLEAANVEHVERNMMSLADLAEKIFDRHVAVGKTSGQVDEPRMPSLCSSAPIERPGVLLDQEGREFFPFDLGEDSKEIGKATVADPHLLAIENVVFTVSDNAARVRKFIASEPEVASESA